jgi:hypothetical protein
LPDTTSASTLASTRPATSSVEARGSLMNIAWMSYQRVLSLAAGDGRRSHRGRGRRHRWWTSGSRWSSTTKDGQATSGRCRRTTLSARIADLAPDSRWRADRRISHTRVRVGCDALLRLPSSSRTSPRRDGSGILIDLAPVPSSAILFEKMPFMMRT